MMFRCRDQMSESSSMMFRYRDQISESSSMIFRYRDQISETSSLMFRCKDQILGTSSMRSGSRDQISGTSSMILELLSMMGNKKSSCPCITVSCYCPGSKEVYNSFNNSAGSMVLISWKLRKSFLLYDNKEISYLTPTIVLHTPVILNRFFMVSPGLLSYYIKRAGHIQG